MRRYCTSWKTTRAPGSKAQDAPTPPDMPTPSGAIRMLPSCLGHPRLDQGRRSVSCPFGAAYCATSIESNWTNWLGRYCLDSM